MDQLSKALQSSKALPARPRKTAHQVGEHLTQDASGRTASASRAERQDRAIGRDEFVQLYRELFPPLYGFVRFRVGDGHVAEDLTSQVFERALGRLATVREADRVRAWLFAIARNAVADYRRGQPALVGLDQAERLDHLLVESPESEAIRSDDWRQVVAHLASLSDRERELIGLRFAAGLSHREIGQVVGLTESNVAQIVHRAIARLRARLEADEVER